MGLHRSIGSYYDAGLITNLEIQKVANCGVGNYARHSSLKLPAFLPDVPYA